MATCFGAAAYFSLPFEPGSWTCIALTLFSVFVFACIRFRLNDPSRIVVVASWLFCAFSIGGLAGKMSTVRHAQPVLTEAVGPIMVEGWITEIEPARRGHRLRIDIQGVSGQRLDAGLSTVRLTQIRPLQADVGRYVRCWSVLRPPPAPVLPWDYAFDRHAYFERLDAVGYVQGACRAAGLGPRPDVGNRLQHTVSTMRRQTALYVAAQAGDRAGGFAAALMSGDRSLMSEADREALRGSGLAHLMAISGLHMGLVCGLVFVFARRLLGLIEPLALRWSAQKGAAICALLAGAAYLIMSGASVSTQRAFIMALVFFAAICADRRALSLQSLAIAMLIIVLWEPWSVLTPGFQMSFAATGALVSVYEVWRARRAENSLPLKGASFWLKSLMVTAIVSSVATAPFALFHFDRVASFGVFANLIAMPVISLCAAPIGIMAAALSFVGLGEVPLALFGRALEIVLSIAYFFSGDAADSGMVQRTMPALSLVGFSLTIATLCIFQGRLVFLTILPSFLGMVAWFSAPNVALHWAPNGHLFFQNERGQMERAILANGDGLVPIGWRDVKIEADCRRVACKFHTLFGDILLSGTAEPVICRTAVVRNAGPRQAKAASDSCASTIAHWSKVSAQGGFTLLLKQGRLVELKSADCGERPWRVCRKSNRNDE